MALPEVRGGECRDAKDGGEPVGYGTGDGAAYDRLYERFGTGGEIGKRVGALSRESRYSE